MLGLPTQSFHLLHQRPRVPHGDRLRPDAYLHLFADQTRRHRVDVGFHPDRAPPADPHPGPLQRLQPPRRQRTQLAQLLPPGCRAAAVALRHHRQHELPVRLPAAERAAATQQQGLLQGFLEASMPLLAVAVLVAAGGVGRLRLQTVVTQQGLVLRRVLLRRPLVVDRQRHPIGPVPRRHAAQFPQRILQAQAQAGETLRKAQRDVFPVRGRQHEVVDQVRKRLALEGHPQGIHVGEVRSTQPTGLVPVGEEHFTGRTVLGFPLPDPPLQGAAALLPVAGRFLTLQPLEQGLGWQPRLALEEFLQTGPDSRQRIGSCPPGMGRGGVAGGLGGVAILACGFAVHACLHRCERQRRSLLEGFA
jgi:hypothetical protein